MQVTAAAPDGTRYRITVEHPQMQVGLTATTADYHSHFAAFPQAAFCRVFAAPGYGLPDWGAPSLAWLPVWVRPWISFKDWPSEATLIEWLDRVTRPVTVTWQHERDNDKGGQAQSRSARADWFARWRDLMAIIDGHRNRPLVSAMPIQTLQWTAAKSTAKSIKGDGDWRTWHVGVGDGAAMDCYVDSWADRYPDPEKFLALPFELAEGAGRRLWIPELGSVLLGDDTGPGRAAWIRDVTALLAERGCAGVAWWCAIGKPGAKGEVRDFHLSDRPSADAWREATERGAG